MLLLLLPLAVSAQFNFDEFGVNNRRCKLYSCDKGYEPVPKKKMRFTSPGCDAMGAGGINLFGPEEDEDGKPYETCCHQWHACYQICGTSKQSCDENYNKCVEIKCKDADEYCVEQANQSMMMSNLGGCKSFELAQSQACDCITKYGDRHKKAREEGLRKFYKLYAPPSAAKKVPELMKKAETSVKLAKLLQKLVAKYPDSIELVEDAQTKMYRQMFGNSGFGGGMGDSEYEEEDEFGEDEFGSDEFGEADFGNRGRRAADDIEDFDVDEDLGGGGDEEEEEVPPPPPKKEKKKRKKDPPPVEEEKPYDEFDQYQEL